MISKQHQLSDSGFTASQKPKRRKLNSHHHSSQHSSFLPGAASLPAEVLAHILSYVEIGDLLTARQSGKLLCHVLTCYGLNSHVFHAEIVDTFKSILLFRQISDGIESGGWSRKKLKWLAVRMKNEGNTTTQQIQETIKQVTEDCGETIHPRVLARCYEMGSKQRDVKWFCEKASNDAKAMGLLDSRYYQYVEDRSLWGKSSKVNLNGFKWNCATLCEYGDSLDFRTVKRESEEFQKRDVFLGDSRWKTRNFQGLSAALGLSLDCVRQIILKLRKIMDEHNEDIS